MKTASLNCRSLARNFVIASMTLIGLLSLPQKSFGQQWSNNGNNISNTNSGNVGVGTSAPYHRLEVAGGGASVGLVPGNTSAYGANALLSRIVARSNYGAVDNTSAAEIQFLTGSTAWYKGQIAFFTNSYDSTQGGYTLERMRITEAGNVGIGTSSPANQLHVNNASGAASLLVSGQGLGVVNIQDPSAAANAKMYQWRSEGGVFRMSLINDNWSSFVQQNLLVATSSGNVGIGTGAPASKLFVGSGTPAVSTLSGLNVALGGNSYISASNGTVNTFIGADTNPYGIVGTLSNHPLGFKANNVLAMSILPNGNVGIGTTTPGKPLDVVGDINASGTITGGNIKAKYQDVAEWVETTEVLPGGTVVILDPTKSNQVIGSTQAYDSRVAGVISLKPGVELGEQAEGRVLVATTGRVKVKVDATSGPIQIGDLLVTSDKVGMAMKSLPLEIGGVRIHRPGTLIGKALEPLDHGTGEILVLLSLQ